MESYRRAWRIWLGLPVLALVLAACGLGNPLVPRLRITNGGTTDIHNLTVRFPKDEVVFGDLAAGQTSDYVEVPNGVYGYAAYQLDVNGQTVFQPVIDWVGEKPMAGHDFTYTIEFDPGQANGVPVKLTNVTTDK